MTPECKNGHPLVWFNIRVGAGWSECLTCGARSRADKPLLEDRLWAQTFADPNTGCWLWAGTVDKDGYGQIKVAGKTKRAHIVSFKLIIGEFSPELQLDHLCRTRPCVRPDHLEPVTTLVNTARGANPAGVVLATGFCQRGHKMSPDNLVAGKQCRKCFQVQNRKAVARYKLRNKMTAEQKERLYG